jgi:putative ABC transport system substrate-binding protein
LTGSSDDTTPKQLELLTTFVAKASRIAVLGNPATATYNAVLRSAQSNAEKGGFSIVPKEAGSPQEIDTLGEENVRAVLAAGDAVLFNQRRRIAELAIRNRLPSMFSQREYAVSGGLMSYGENLSNFFHRAAFFVDQIFKGASPADLPVEQPTQFHLVINRKTADELAPVV